MFTRSFARILTLFLVPAFTLIPTLSPAQQSGPKAAADAATIMVMRAVQAGKSVAEIRDWAMQMYDRSDIDGGGIGESDDKLREDQAAAAWRVRKLTGILTHDLDGDGAVTEAELRRSLTPQSLRPLRSAAGTFAPTPEQAAATLDNLVSRMNLPDTDGDGRATIAEILKAAMDEYATARRPRHPEMIGLEFDADGNGTVTREEYETAIDAALAKADVDEDGTIAAFEAQSFKQDVAAVQQRDRMRLQREKQAAAMRTRVEACAIPPVPPQAGIIYFAMLKSEIHAPVTFGQPHIPTNLADIRIEEGRRPIYLITASYSPMILRFSGAVDRLVQVVNLHTQTMGFVGLPREKVAWAETKECALRGYNPAATVGSAVLERDYLEALAGRRIDLVMGRNSVGMIGLPSGDALQRDYDPGQTERTESLTGPTWKRAESTRPQGLPEVTQESVIAPVRTVPYKAPN